MLRGSPLENKCCPKKLIMAVYIFLPSQQKQKYVIYTLRALCVSAVRIFWFRLCRDRYRFVVTDMREAGIR
jgi:hypothetical protein